MYLNRDMDGGPFLIYFLPILGGRRPLIYVLFPSHSWWATSFNICFISFSFFVGRKLQRQTQQRDGVQPATSELPGCRSAWTIGRMTGRADSGAASFVIQTSFNI